MTFSLFLLAAILLSFLLVAWFRRLKQSRFEVTLDVPDLFRFETDLGRFQINRKHGRFDAVTADEKRHYLLSDIDRIEFQWTKKHALMEEILFGYHITDLFEVYRDTIDYYVILVHPRNALPVPVYAACQYQQRDFLSGWYIKLQQVLLGRLGLFKDGYVHSTSVYMQLREAFAASGIRSGSA